MSAVAGPQQRAKPVFVFFAGFSQFCTHFEQTRPNRVFFWLLAAALLMTSNAAIPLPEKTHVNRRGGYPTLGVNFTLKLLTQCSFGPPNQWAHGVVVSHPLSMREALGSIPSVSISSTSPSLPSTNAGSPQVKTWHKISTASRNA